MKVSREEIEAAKTPAGGWTKAQLAAWGVPWPPPKGWRKKIESGEPAAVPVAWVKFGLIRDRDGRAIGQDEPDIRWQEEKPSEAKDPWLALYASAQDARVTDLGSCPKVEEDDVAQILFSVQRGAMRLRDAAVAIMELYEAAAPPAAPQPAPVAEVAPVAWQVCTRNKDGSWSSPWITDQAQNPDDYRDGYGVEITPLGPIQAPSAPYQLDEAMVERAAMAHDQEESAQKGEPSPWTHGNCDDQSVSESECEDCKAFRDERLSTMRVALKAALSGM